MKALVTGGAGFIGSHLAQALLGRGWLVACVDDLSTGSRANLAATANHPSLTFVQGSVLDEPLVGRLVSDCDVVFHLASAVGVRLIVDQPVLTIDTIFHGTDNVLRAAREHGNKPVLITSSSEVYGKGVKVPFHENDDVVLGPTTTRRWSYACAKMLDEFLALAHWHETKLPVVCVRLFNTAGPRQTGQYGMVLPRFVRQALSNQPVTVYGDGRQSRCFCHVSDAVDAMVRLIQTPAAHGQVINIGSEQEITMHDLAQRIIKLTGSSSPITLIPYDQAYTTGFEDMRRRVPDLSLAGKLIGYQPRFDIDQIIRSVIEHVKSTGGA